MENNDEKWMKRCFVLAQKGEQYVSPNPVVGAVILKNGKFVAEGFHERFGGPHAEINAITKAHLKGVDLHGAWLYVNLEPCFHYGNTPPCVNAIIENGFARVIISTKDPNPLVAGKSIQKLRRHGIDCRIGVQFEEGSRINERFFTFITAKKPFIALKAAQTNDGFIAKTSGRSKWITNKLSRTYVHQLRRRYDAVLVGANTVVVDNPELTVRHVKGKNPIRILLDGSLSTPITKKIFNKKAPTLVYTSSTMTPSKKRKISVLKQKGIVVECLPSKKGKLKIKSVLRNMFVRNISSVLVEGGQQTYMSFLYEHCVDKIYLFTSKKLFREGIKTFDDLSIHLRFSAKVKRRFAADSLEELYLK